MGTRRTTLAADPDDLALLEGEAKRRGVSLAQILRETVAQQAEQLRSRRRPRSGIGHSGARGGYEASAKDKYAPVHERPFRT